MDGCLRCYFAPESYVGRLCQSRRDWNSSTILNVESICNQIGVCGSTGRRRIDSGITCTILSEWPLTTFLTNVLPVRVHTAIHHVDSSVAPTHDKGRISCIANFGHGVETISVRILVRISIASVRVSSNHCNHLGKS
jgi:hypothetical protein